LVIDSNTVTYSKYGMVLDMSGVNNVTVSNNNISRCSTMVAIAKGDSAPTSGVFVYGNTFADGHYWDFDGVVDLFHGDGLHMWTGTGAFTDVSVYRNNMLTDWGRHTTGAIFLEGNYGTLNIHNNLIGTLAEKLEGIINLGGSNNTNLNLHNNTVVGMSTSNIGGTAVYLQGSTWGSVNARNNIFYNFYSAVSISNTQAIYVLNFDNNNYYSLGNIATRFNPVNTDQVGSHETLASWSSYLGGDEASGKTVNPMFVSGSNWSLQSSSQLIDAGVILGSAYASDFLGVSRPQGSGWDIGVYEYGGSQPAPDTIPPTVSISTPLNGATVSGSSVSLGATASDNIGVIGVQFKLDGVNLGSELTTAPYSGSWNTLSVSNGTHTLTATARDLSGNSTISSNVTITVSNTITTPTNGTCGSTQNICTLGTLQDTTDTGASYLWNCLGLNGGTTASCSLTKPVTPSVPTNGTCGSTQNICTTGIFLDTANTLTNYLWSCTGSNGGTTASCSALIPVTTTPSTGGGGGSSSSVSTGTFTPTVTQIPLPTTNTTNSSITSGQACVATTELGKIVELFISMGVIKADKVASARAYICSLSGTNPSTSSVQAKFTRNLYLGIEGEDVKQLQVFLNSKGFLIATSGRGSKGNEITYFGPGTKSALAKYQASQSLPANGYFGPLTRARIK
jgi:hypothetical protein